MTGENGVSKFHLLQYCCRLLSHFWGRRSLCWTQEIPGRCWPESRSSHPLSSLCSPGGHIESSVVERCFWYWVVGKVMTYFFYATLCVMTFLMTRYFNQIYFTRHTVLLFVCFKEFFIYYHLSILMREREHYTGSKTWTTVGHMGVCRLKPPHLLPARGLTILACKLCSLQKYLRPGDL